MVFLVAEIGVNWNGDFDIVKELINKSKEIGFDAVKFQAFNGEILGNNKNKEKLLTTSINENNISEIDKIAKSNNIEWFCTPMYPDAVDFLDDYVNKYKIRVSDSTTLLENKKTKLIEKIFETKKDIIISVQNNPEKCIFYNEQNIKWLYCVSKYPCSLEDLDFTEIKKYNGFSNHCPNYIAPLTAAILGAEIIEVHVTKNLKGDFADNNVSFDYDGMKKIVDSIRSTEKIKIKSF